MSKQHAIVLHPYHQSSISVRMSNPMWNPHNEHCIETYRKSYEHYGMQHPGIYQQHNRMEHYPFYHTQQHLQMERNPVYHPNTYHPNTYHQAHPNMMYATIPLRQHVMYDKPDVYRSIPL